MTELETQELRASLRQDPCRQAAIDQTALAYALTQEQAAELVDNYVSAVQQRVLHGAGGVEPEGLNL